MNRFSFSQFFFASLFRKRLGWPLLVIEFFLDGFQATDNGPDFGSGMGRHVDVVADILENVQCASDAHALVRFLLQQFFGRFKDRGTDVARNTVIT
jgi:hypothetical protein